MRTLLLITLTAIATLSSSPPAPAQPTTPTVAGEDLRIDSLCAAIDDHRTVHAYGRTFTITHIARAGSYVIADVVPTPPEPNAAATIVLQHQPNGTCRDVALAPEGELTQTDLQTSRVPDSLARALIARFHHRTGPRRRQP